MAHNFFVGDLGFHKVMNDDHPYERATAPFRKEQFDAAATVGDQSLTGWWTRGQLSFHRGGGVKYYEVLDGDEVLNRFNTSSGVDPWTPGQLGLTKNLQALAAANVRDVANVADLLSGDRLLVLKTDGTLHVAESLGGDFSTMSIAPLATSGPTTTKYVNGVTSSAFRGYVAVENRIEVYVVGDTATTTLWTQSDGLHFVNVWYAKSRLWAADTNGNWYMLSTAGGSIAATAAAFTIPETGWLIASRDLFAVTETPGPLLICAYNRIYAIGLDETAATPTPDAPVAVAILPNDEFIATISYENGILAIATSRGARFGMVGVSEVVYGPLVNPDINHIYAQKIVSSGSRVLIGGLHADGTAGIFAYDVTNTVSDLVPGHALMYPITQGSFMGAYGTAQGLVMWSDQATSMYRTALNDLRSGGEITTGFHRFGTLEGKHFHEVLVRTDGSGTISVYRVDMDGSETLLDTINAADKEAIIGIGLSAPVERIALKFVLTRDASDSTAGPELLGYQLKALPSPKRQELIRIPLMMYDIERGPTGRAVGREKDAWARYSALVALEASDALVAFEDKDTGETGTAYIESVELVQRNGSKGVSRANGFGGIVSLTLRKVA